MASWQDAPAIQSAPSAASMAPAPTWDTAPTIENASKQSAKDRYDLALRQIRATYYPDVSDAKWAEISARAPYQPYTAGDLFSSGLAAGLGDEAASLSGAFGDLLQGKDPIQGFKNWNAFEQARRDYGKEKAGLLGDAAQIGGMMLMGRPDFAAPRIAGLVPAMVEGGKAGLAQGAVTGFGYSDGDLTTRAIEAAKAAGISGAVGAAAPAVFEGVKRVIAPPSKNPAYNAMVQTLRNEGVDLSIGQATNNTGMRYTEAAMGGSKADDLMQKQLEQFSQAALKRAGIDAPRVTPEIMDDAFTKVGAQFDDLAARNGVQADPDLATSLMNVWRDYSGNVNPNAMSPRVEKTIKDIAEKAFKNGYGFVDGTWYKVTRSDLVRAMKTTSSPETKMAYEGIVEALDDAAERTIAAVNPADLGAWGDVRRLYRNLKVIERAYTSAGADAASGLITPKALRTSSMNNEGRVAFSRGFSDFTDLANAGNVAMTPLPQSGTAPRLLNSVPFAKQMLGLAAGGAAGAPFGATGAAIGGISGVVAPWLAENLLMSQAARNFLTQPAGRATSNAGNMVGRALLPYIMGQPQ